MVSLFYPTTVFNTSDWGDPNSSDYFGPPLKDNTTVQPHETCRYLAYREPPDHPEEDQRYGINKIWLHVFAARLGFIVIFEVKSTCTVRVKSVVRVPNLYIC